MFAGAMSAPQSAPSKNKIKVRRPLGGTDGGSSVCGTRRSSLRSDPGDTKGKSPGAGSTRHSSPQHAPGLSSSESATNSEERASRADRRAPGRGRSRSTISVAEAGSQETSPSRQGLDVDAMRTALERASNEAKRARAALRLRSETLDDTRRRLAEERRERAAFSVEAVKLEAERQRLEEERCSLTDRVSHLEAQLAAQPGQTGAGCRSSQQLGRGVAATVSCRLCRLSFATVEDWEIHRGTVYHRMRESGGGRHGDSDTERAPSPVSRRVSSKDNRPDWCPDKEARSCYSCSNKFSVTRRKHHCRHCGEVVCGKCSANFLEIPQFAYTTKQRVCDACAAVLHGQKLEWFPSTR